MRRHLILMSAVSGLLACADGADGSGDVRDSHILAQQADAGTPLITNLGAACTADTDCKGTGTRCITTSQASGLTYPGGYCTASCANDAECGDKGWCPLATTDAGVFPSPEIQKAVTVCVVKCEVASDCREGYVCSSESTLSFLPPSGSTQKFCRPPPKT